MNAQQAARLHAHFECARQLYNALLAEAMKRESQSYQKTRRRLARAERKLAAHRRSLHAQPACAACMRSLHGQPANQIILMAR